MTDHGSTEPEASWFPHNPTSDIPATARKVRFKDGSELNGVWARQMFIKFWNHTHPKNENHITHYKP